MEIVIVIVIGVAILVLFVMRSSYKGVVGLAHYERRKVENNLASLSVKLESAERINSTLNAEVSRLKKNVDDLSSERQLLESTLEVKAKENIDLVRRLEVQEAERGAATIGDLGNVPVDASVEEAASGIAYELTGDSTDELDNAEYLGEQTLRQELVDAGFTIGLATALCRGPGLHRRAIDKLFALLDAGCTPTFAELAIQFPGLDKGDLSEFITKVEHVLDSKRNRDFEIDEDDDVSMPSVVYEQGQADLIGGGGEDISLEALAFESAATTPIYDCPKCKDKGYIPEYMHVEGGRCYDCNPSYVHHSAS